jgi:hypothetical protein
MKRRFGRSGAPGREPFGKAGLAIAVLALILATAGGAYAAQALSGKQKKEVEKIAKKVDKAAPQGPAGSTGPTGAAGPAGGKGDAGAQGTPGAAGAPGKNGKDGAFAPELPPGKTETGIWSVGRLPAEVFGAYVPISFAYPLPTDGAAKLHFIAIGATAPPECPGTAAEPLAEEGNICVYEGNGFGMTFESIENPGNTGEEVGAVGVILNFTGPENGSARGTWALTAAN